MSGLGTVCPLPPIYNTCRPPEAVTGAVASVQTDIYQVGLLLYRMVNGDPWFKDQSSLPRPELEAKITKGRFPDRKRFYPHVTRHMRTVIRKALSLDPLQRYQTATEMATVLGRVDVSRWEIEVTPHRTAWTWERKAPHADVMVEECRTTAGTSVAVFTLGDVKRAKSPGALRRRGLTPEASWKHLNDVVFPTLRKSL